MYCNDSKIIDAINKSGNSKFLRHYNKNELLYDYLSRNLRYMNVDKLKTINEFLATSKDEYKEKLEYGLDSYHMNFIKGLTNK